MLYSSHYARQKVGYVLPQGRGVQGSCGREDKIRRPQEALFEKVTASMLRREFRGMERVRRNWT